MAKMPETPELDRLNKVADEIRVLAEFVEEFLPQQQIRLHQWMTELTDQRVCYGKGGLFSECQGDDCSVCGGTGFYEIEIADRYLPYGGNIQDLIYKFFDLDPSKIESERRALLEAIRQ